MCTGFNGTEPLAHGLSQELCDKHMTGFLQILTVHVKACKLIDWKSHNTTIWKPNHAAPLYWHVLRTLSTLNTLIIHINFLHWLPWCVQFFIFIFYFRYSYIVWFPLKIIAWIKAWHSINLHYVLVISFSFINMFLFYFYFLFLCLNHIIFLFSNWLSV